MCVSAPIHEHNSSVWMAAHDNAFMMKSSLPHAGPSLRYMAPPSLLMARAAATLNKAKPFPETVANHVAMSAIGTIPCLCASLASFYNSNNKTASSSPPRKCSTTKSSTSSRLEIIASTRLLPICRAVADSPFKLELSLSNDHVPTLSAARTGLPPHVITSSLHCRSIQTTTS